MDNIRVEAFANLGKDPEQKYTDYGKLITSVSAAVETGSGDYKKTEWVRLTIWGEKFGNLFNSMVQKGTYVWISGVPKVNAWKDNDGEAKSQLDITVRDFRVLKGGRPRGEEEQTPYDE